MTAQREIIRVRVIGGEVQVSIEREGVGDYLVVRFVAGARVCPVRDQPPENEKHHACHPRRRPSHSS